MKRILALVCLALLLLLQTPAPAFAAVDSESSGIDRWEETIPDYRDPKVVESDHFMIADTFFPEEPDLQVVYPEAWGEPLCQAQSLSHVYGEEVDLLFMGCLFPEGADAISAITTTFDKVVASRGGVIAAHKKDLPDAAGVLNTAHIPGGVVIEQIRIEGNRVAVAVASRSDETSPAAAEVVNQFFLNIRF